MAVDEAEVAIAQDRRWLVATASLVLFVFAVYATAQGEVFLDRLDLSSGAPSPMPRVLSSAMMIAANAALLVGFGVHRVRSSAWMVAFVIAVSGLSAAFRAVVLEWLGVYDQAYAGGWLEELILTGGVATTANALGALYMTSRRSAREQERAALHQALQIELALKALQYEEVRVRREVAEGLHGSLQQRLVLINARIDTIIDHVVTGDMSEADTVALREIRADLEMVREGDVREMSRLLYPDGLEIGMIPAIRSLLGRLPTSIGTRLVVSDAVRRIDDPASPSLSQTERLLVVRVVEEAVTNALRHGAASRLDVEVREEDGRLAVAVHDNGSGYEPGSGGGVSGLARLTDRLSIAGGTLEVSSMPGAGTTVQAWLPILAVEGASPLSPEPTT